MNTPRRILTKDFKLEAVKMVLEGGFSKSEVAKRLDVAAPLIGKWVSAFRSDGSDAFPGKWNLKPEDELLLRLDRENRDLREQDAFSKKKHQRTLRA